MSTLDDLLDDVRAQPDDWASWLVLADWLLEQGDERAGLIRLEHQSATGALSPGGKRLLRQKRQALEQVLRQELLGRLASVRNIQLDWHCGFVRGVRLRYVPDWLSPLQSIASSPTGHLWTSLSLSGTELGVEGALQLAQSLLLLGLTTLQLDSTGLGDSAAKVLAQSPMLCSVIRLDLGHNALSDEGALQLARSDALPFLAALDLSQNSIGYHGATALIHSAELRELAQLDLWRNPCGASRMALQREAALRGRSLRI
jgi:uncharacterized protein (TIGR02996 family)